MREKPEIFEDLSDALFDQLPVNYRLMRKIPVLPTHLAHSDWFTSAQFVCEPSMKPITKILPSPEKETA